MFPRTHRADKPQYLVEVHLKGGAIHRFAQAQAPFRLVDEVVVPCWHRVRALAHFPVASVLRFTFR